MKVYLHLKDCLEDSLKMTVKISLPKSWLDGPAQRLVDTFAEAYNKKHPDADLVAADFHFEHADGTHVPFDAPPRAAVSDGEDLYLKRGAAQSMEALGFQPPPAADASAAGDGDAKMADAAAPSAPPVRRSIAEMKAAADAKLAEEVAAAAPGSASGSADASAVGSAGASGSAGDASLLVCRHFNCGAKFREAENRDDACRYHAKPPVFHETRKFWACCPDKIAWDWDSFTAIDGCCTGRHSTQAPDTQFLGGSDMRREQAEAAGVITTGGPPQRLRSALDKLSALRAALVDLGVRGAHFDAARDKLKAAREAAAGEAGADADADAVWARVAEDVGAWLDRALQQPPP